MKLLMEYRTPQTRISFKNNLINNDKHMIIKADECDKKAAVSINIKNSSTNSKFNKLYQCNFCEQSFSRNVLLKRHKVTWHKRIHRKIELINKITKKSSEENLEKTEKQNSDNENTIIKRKGKKLEPYRCIYCDDFVANGKRALVTHCKEMHADIYNKSNKNERTIDKTDIENAKMEIEGKIYYHCGECGKNLHSPYTFSWHMRIHTGERPFTCHLCGKQFRVNQGLARHLRETHAGIKNFPCDICGRMFSTKRNAEDHRRIHTGERPYVCNVCGKSFKQKASLFVHNRTHSNHFPFKCSYCDQCFRTKPPLIVHITKHTGEKPYECDICQRRFRIKYELKRHRLVHFDEKPWQCADCNLSFRQKRYLVNHRKLNHSDSNSSAA